MSSASEAKHTLDWLKWLVVVALVAAGIISIWSMR